MHLLQDWTFIAGNGVSSIVQRRSEWLDLSRFSDAVLWLEVRSAQNPAGGAVRIQYETAPAEDESLFQAAAAINLTAGAGPLITKIRLADNPNIPLAQFLRWKLRGTAAGDWSATFRVFVTGGAALAAGTYDPSALDLSGWWRASYSSSPWTGTVSAGASGSRDLTEATNPPSVGAALNGLTPPDFDGSNDLLSNALALSNYVTASRWWCAVLFTIDAFTSNAATITNNTTLVGDTGPSWGLYQKGSGGSGTLYAYQSDGAVKFASAAIVTSAWYLAVAWYDGSTINLVLNGAAQTPASAGAIASLTSGLRVGQNYQGPSFGVLDGRIVELAISPTGYGANEAFNFKSYVNARYALAL